MVAFAPPLTSPACTSSLPSYPDMCSTTVPPARKAVSVSDAPQQPSAPNSPWWYSTSVQAASRVRSEIKPKTRGARKVTVYEEIFCALITDVTVNQSEPNTATYALPYLERSPYRPSRRACCCHRRRCGGIAGDAPQN